MTFLHDRQVNSGRRVPLIEEFSYNNEAFHDNETDFNSLCGKEGTYTIRDDMFPRPPSLKQFRFRDLNQRRHITIQSMNSINNNMLPILVMPEPLPTTSSPPILTNGKVKEKVLDKSASFSEGTYRGHWVESPPGQRRVSRLERRHTADRIETRGNHLIPTEFRITASISERRRQKDSEGCKDDVLVVGNSTSNLIDEHQESHEGYSNPGTEIEVVEEGRKEEEEDANSLKFMDPSFYSTDEDDTTLEERPRLLFKFRRPKAPRALRDKECSTPKDKESHASDDNPTSGSLPMEDSEVQVEQDVDSSQSIYLDMEDNSVEV